MSEQLKNIKSILSGISQYDSHELTERQALGEINFAEIKPTLEETIKIAAKLNDLPLQVLSEDELSEISSAGKHIFDNIEKLQNFRIEGRPDPTSERNAFRDQTNRYCTNFQMLARKHIPYLTIESPQFQTFFQQSDSLIKNLQKGANSKFEELESQVKGKIESLDTALQIVQDAAAQTGVARHSQKFKNAADSHEKSSRNWLIASIVLVGVTVLVAILSLYLFPIIGEVNDASIIQRIIAKAVLISILYYSAIWSAKNYRAHRHLAVLNSHRQNALETFETFVQGAGGDEQTKNAVLLEATRCIFSHVNSGYLDGDESGSSNSIIELVKTVGSSSSGK